MHIVFTKDVKGVATKGEVKNVARGYFRNFLVPQNAAVMASEGQIAHANELQKQAMAKREKLAAKANEMKEKLEAASYNMTAKVSKKDKLYGSVSASDIVELVEKSAGIELDKSNVIMKNGIKKTGEHEVSIKLSESVSAVITISVSAQ